MVLSCRRAPLWHIKLTGRVLLQPPHFSGAMVSPCNPGLQDFTDGAAAWLLAWSPGKLGNEALRRRMWRAPPLVCCDCAATCATR